MKGRGFENECSFEMLGDFGQSFLSSCIQTFPVVYFLLCFSGNQLVKLVLYRKTMVMKRACSLNTNTDEDLTCEFHPTIKKQIIYG